MPFSVKQGKLMFVQSFPRKALKSKDTVTMVCSPLASSSGNIFQDDDKENSRDYTNGRSQSRASQHSYNSSLSFNPNSHGPQERSQGGKGGRDSVQSPSGAHDRGHKEGERSDKSRDAAAQW